LRELRRIARVGDRLGDGGGVFWGGLHGNLATREIRVDLGARHYEERYKDRIVRSMKKRLHDLGYAVTIEPMVATAES